MFITSTGWPVTPETPENPEKLPEMVDTPEKGPWNTLKIGMVPEKIWKKPAKFSI